MPKQDNLHKDALNRLAVGINRCASVVAQTMGPKGKNVMIQHELRPFHQITNDGATIIQSMQFADPIENMGLNLLKEAAERSNSNSGDGSSTMTVLLDAIVQEGLKSNASPLEIKQSLDECLPIIEASIDDQTKQTTVEQIPAVAAIAGESESLANTLGEIYKEIGSEGIVHLEGSGTFETTYQIIKGVRLAGTGYLSPYMAHDEQAKKEGRKETKAIYHNPAILVTKNKISHLNDINPLLGALHAQNKKDLVIFTDDMDSGVASALIDAHKAGVINLLIIKAPVLWKSYVFEDFAKITNSTIVEDASGINFKKLQLNHLGTCETIIVDKDETTIIGTFDLTDHIKSIQEDESLPHDLKQIRTAYLKTKTAILKLGAKSETELSYLRLKAEDAIHSSRLALQSGIVVGGGKALLQASTYLPKTVGGMILEKALRRPICQIVENAGTDPNKLPDIGINKGFNAKTGEIVDMFEANIIDSATVVKQAIRNAVGIASTLLTTSAVITLPPKLQDNKQNYPFI